MKINIGNKVQSHLLGGIFYIYGCKLKISIMKVESFEGKMVNVTLPAKENCYGDVKINGVVVGTWIQNCEMMWHAKINYGGKVLQVWSRREFGKQGLSRSVRKAIEENKNIWG